MPTQTQTKIPNPIYAAAGAGDLAMERLRKLPEKVAGIQERVAKAQDELPGRFTVIQDKVTQKVAELPSIVAELRQRMVDTDTDKFRATARRNAGVFVANAQAAQEKAVTIYSELVARGERVVGGDAPAQRTERIQAEMIPAADEATSEANVEKIHAVAEAAAAADAAAAKPVKRVAKATKAPKSTN
jgi:hypothetical protein